MKEIVDSINCSLWFIRLYSREEKDREYFKQIFSNLGWTQDTVVQFWPSLCHATLHSLRERNVAWQREPEHWRRRPFWFLRGDAHFRIRIWPIHTGKNESHFQGHCRNPNDPEVTPTTNRDLRLRSPRTAAFFIMNVSNHIKIIHHLRLHIPQPANRASCISYTYAIVWFVYRYSCLWCFA